VADFEIDGVGDLVLAAALEGVGVTEAHLAVGVDAKPGRRGDEAGEKVELGCVGRGPIV